MPLLFVNAKLVLTGSSQGDPARGSGGPQARL